VTHSTNHGISQPSVAIVSTFPPTACGLATFSAALAAGFRQIGLHDIGIVRSSDDGSSSDDPRVVVELRPDDWHSIDSAVHALNSFDCVVLQHEYGIFGGNCGDDVLRILSQLTVPVVTTLHTVPTSPDAHQKRVLEDVVNLSDYSITMTAAARERLLSHYDVRPADIVTIPHGATLPPPVASRSATSPTVLTWGLLGPGKGIEWVIDALAEVSDVVPPITYVVAGATHPKVLAREGERYRESLMQRATERQVEDRVIFDQQYRTLPELLDMVSRATAVVLPYDSTDQITSGVLVDAVAAGVPVVATAFPHAVELLSSGAGVVVPHQSPPAIADALRTIVTRPNVAQSMRSRAAQLAADHSWPCVAAKYLELIEHVLSPGVVQTPQAVSA
jgi:polysaccharide biosynthesis protein PslF